MKKSPAQCLVLEDTAHGVEAAKRAGMVCIATPSEFAFDHDFSKADYIRPDLETPEPTTFETALKMFS